jgi:hypothetical protein
MSALPMLGRTSVGLGLLLAWGSLGHVTRTAGMPYAPLGLDALPMNGGIALGFTLVFLGAWTAFVRGRAPDLAAVIIVMLFALGNQILEWQQPPGVGVNGATALPGAALTAWWVARRTSRTPDERTHRGVEAACGIVAASYALAMLSKVYTSGFTWASAGNMGMQIATQGYLVPEPFQSVRLAAAASTPLCAALGVATLILEGGALLFVLPALRVPIAALLVGMHVGISALMGLHHYEWMFTALGWALVSAGARRAS